MNRVSKKLALVVTVIASAIAFGATQDAGAFTPTNALTTIAGGGTTAATQFGDGFNAVLGNQTVAYVSGMAVNPASGDLYYSQGGNGNYSTTSSTYAVLLVERFTQLQEVTTQVSNALPTALLLVLTQPEPPQQAPPS